MVIHELRDGLRSMDPDLVFLQEVQGLNQRFAMRFATCPVAPQHEFLAGRNGSMSTAATRSTTTAITATPSCRAFASCRSRTRMCRTTATSAAGCCTAWSRCRVGAATCICVCVHLSLHERGRNRQLEAISGRLEELASRDLPIIVAGDFNDWRHRATAILERRLGMTEVRWRSHGRAMATYPSVLPLLRLDRIYVRGFKVVAARVHRGKPWSLLSDHLAVSAELERA